MANNMYSEGTPEQGAIQYYKSDAEMQEYTKQQAEALKEKGVTRSQLQSYLDKEKNTYLGGSMAKTATDLLQYFPEEEVPVTTTDTSYASVSPDLADGQTLQSYLNENFPNDAHDPSFAALMESRDFRELAINQRGVKATSQPYRQGEYVSTWDKIKSSWETMGGLKNYAHMAELRQARKISKNLNFRPEGGDTLKDVPEAYAGMILDEREKHGEYAAHVVRLKLLDDLKNERIQENMSWYAQLGYGLGATLLDPTTWVGAGAIGVASKGATRGKRLWETLTNKQIGATPNLAKWAGGSLAEGAIINAPRLAADYTYDAKDYTLDVLAEGAFGTALGGGVGAYKAYSKNKKAYRDSHKASLQELDGLLTKDGSPLSKEDEQAITANVIKLTGEQPKTEHGTIVGKHTDEKQDALLPVIETPEFASITSVSSKGFEHAYQTLANTYDYKSPMFFWLRQQRKLNKRTDLTPEMREEVEKLNADFLHIASAYPDGKIPKHVQKAINGVKFKQRNHDVDFVIQGLVTGTHTDPVDSLKTYNRYLANQNIWDGQDMRTESMSFAEFREKNEAHLTLDDSDVDAEEIFHLSQTHNKETSFIKDMIEINRRAEISGDPKLITLVENLNAMVNKRLDDIAKGNQAKYIDSTKGFKGKTRAMTAPEMVQKLHQKGVKQYTDEWENFLAEMRQKGVKVGTEQFKTNSKLAMKQFSKTTPEWKAGMAELRKSGRVPISDDVRQMDDSYDYVHGYDHSNTEYDFRNEDSQGNQKESAVRESMREELAELQKLAKPHKEDVARIDYLEQELSKPEPKLPTALVGIKDDGVQDVLPRAMSDSNVHNLYGKNEVPTMDALRAMRKNVKSQIIDKLGVKRLGKKTKTSEAHAHRLSKIRKAMLAGKTDKILQRMVKSGQWENLEDVIRVSEQLRQENAIRKERMAKNEAAKAEQTKEKSSSQKQNEEPETVALTEEKLATVTEPRAKANATDKEKADVEHTVKGVYKELVTKSATKILTGLKVWQSSGLQKAYKRAIEPTGMLDRFGRVLGKLTEDLASKFQNSDLDTLQYFGNTVTELGRGFAGNMRRNATAGIIKDINYRQGMMEVVPSYTIQIDAYARSKGAGEYAALKAKTQAGMDNPIVDEFSREVFKVQELRRQGKPVEGIHESVLHFVNDFDKHMEANHGRLSDANVAGFKGDNKVKHYIPHIWENSKLQRAIKEHGENKIVQLLTKAYQSSINNRVNPANADEARELAERQVEWIKRQDPDYQHNTKFDEVLDDDIPNLDQYVPTKDSRAKRRLDLNTLEEHEGLSVLDLLNTDVMDLTTKYNQRASGWIGLSKATDGMLTSELDLQIFRKAMVEEGAEKGINTNKYEQWFDDTLDNMFGRPARGGLSSELRQFKDLTALTRMGGLGTAQLIETGNVITRSIISMFSDPTVAKKALSAGKRGATSEQQLLREIQSISHMTDDFEWLERQSVHLDQAQLDNVNKVRQMSLWLADKATFGSLKAPASRLLGKTTGFNAIRRAQARVTQSSLVLDVAKHFKHGAGVMGNARMADLGLTDANGVDAELKAMFNKHVEYGEDGLPIKMNFDKWDKAPRERLQYALARAEAQEIQRTHVGELPPWMNSPLMQLIFQFRQMPLVATNKSMGRAMAFADREAVTAVMLNAAMAGLVRYGKFAALGAGAVAVTGKDYEEPTLEQMQPAKYIQQFGILPDAVDLVTNVYDQKDWRSRGEKVLSEAPVIGLMADYATMSGVTEAQKNEMIDAAQGLLPLGNTAYGDMIFEALNEQLKD